MNPAMRGVIAFVDFVLINIAISLNGGLSTIDMVWYSLCIGLGFGLRVAVLINDNKYSHKTLFVHMAFAVCWCFFMVLLWRTKLNSTWLNQGGNSFEIYLFLNALFSVYMVSQFEQFFKIGFKSWFSLVVGRIIAKEVKEDKL